MGGAAVARMTQSCRKESRERDRHAPNPEQSAVEDIVV